MKVQFFSADDVSTETYLLVQWPDRQLLAGEPEVFVDAVEARNVQFYL